MANLAALMDSKDISIGYAPVQYNYSDTGDIFSAAVDYMTTNINFSAEYNVLNDEIQERNKRFAAALGVGHVHELLDINTISDPLAKAQGYAGPIYKQELNRLIDQRIADGRATNPDIFNTIKTTEEAKQDGMSRAKLSKIEYETAMQQAAPDAWVKTASFAGSFAGSLKDELNLASMFIGAGASKTFMQALFTDAVLNASVELVQQPQVMKWQKELGHKYGIEDAAENVAWAAAFGAGFPAALKGSAMTLRKIGELANMPREQLALLDLWGKKVQIDEANPKKDGIQTDITNQGHIKNVESASKAMDEGRLVDEMELDPSSVPARFAQESVTREHYDVAMKVVEKHGSIDAPKAKQEIKQAFVEQIKKEAEETVAHKELSRKDVEGMKQEVEMIKADLAEFKNKDYKDQAKAILGPKAGSQKLTKLAKKIKSDEVNSRRQRIDQLETDIKNRTEQGHAANDLAQIAEGKIPDRHKQRYRDYKKAIADAANDTGPSFFSFLPPKAKAIDNPQQVLEELKAPEVEQSLAKDFDASVAANPNLVIKHPMTGEDVSISRLYDEIKDDENAFEMLKGCMI